MKIIKLTPKKSLNKGFLKQRPLRSDIDLFKLNLVRLLDKVDEMEREENQKNHLRDFLLDTYYKGSNEINTKDTQDLVIHSGKSNKDPVSVIIEAKRPGNRAEMITPGRPNSKALQELLLYYLRERVDRNNIDIKYLIATNIYEWYIFDAATFEKLFYRNIHLVNEYKDWRDGKKVTKDTNLFYNNIAKPFVENLDEDIPCTYFDIRAYEKILKNENKDADRELIALQKLLSPYFLLRLPFASDSNSLDEKFYRELLFILGLEEIKDGGKNIILRRVHDRQPGSLIENTINILTTEEAMLKVNDRAVYGESKEDQLFGVALELTLTWINRILFLKLLEGQLAAYHREDGDYRFLSAEHIQDFDELYKLFHQVLARPVEERSTLIQAKNGHIPYLNSSLFEISELENATIKINSLDNSETMEVSESSVLKQVKKKNRRLPTLEYLFRFFDAFDFASEGKEDIAEDSKTLINASVLGKVFEKINSYKDGSVFTPGFITMFMCRKSIRMAAVEKFKTVYGWSIDHFDDIKNYLTDRRSSKDILEFNAVINSLRIADIAAGSGHFLVSALNELIAIKFDLGILADTSGTRIRDYEIALVNDELIITHDSGDIFEYRLQKGRPVNKEIQRIQKLLFHEKQTIIENCLFGVDINPNSVKICRLRLWIELLKNAYYKDPDFAELETLPNIDINIKCGNSLLSRFPLNADLSQALRKSKWNIQSYRLAVATYRNAKSKEEKREMENLILTIKQTFSAEIRLNDPIKKRRDKLLNELYHRFTGSFLFDPPTPYGNQTIEDLEKKANQEKDKLEKEIAELTQKLDELKNNTILRQSFEWRFEFPEALDDDGNFIGFDLIIGNPPYIQMQKDGGALAKALEKQNYQTFSRTGDIYMLFYEKGFQLLKDKGIEAFITSSQWLKAAYGAPLRKFLLNYNNLLLISLGPNVFENATVDTNILISEKASFKNQLIGAIAGSEKALVSEKYEKVPMTYIDESAWIIMNPIKQNILRKLNEHGKKLAEWDVRINFGIKTGLNEAFVLDETKRNDLIQADPGSAEIIRPLVRGREVKKYITGWSGSFIIFTHNGLKHSGISRIEIENYPALKSYLDSFGHKLTKRYDQGDSPYNLRNCAYLDEFSKEKVIWKRIGSQLRFSYSDREIYCLDSTCILTGEKIKYLTALLNSKVCQYQMFEQAPRTGVGDLIISVQALEPILVHYPNQQTESEIAGLVDQIITLRQQGKDATEPENQVDKLVYALYDLNEAEISAIEAV